jgi:acyl carrier protein
MPAMATVREQLREVIAEIGEIDDVECITDQADLYQDLKLDSMQALEIVLEIETRFEISVPEEALRRIRSLADAVRVATELGAEDGS